MAAVGGGGGERPVDVVETYSDRSDVRTAAVSPRGSLTEMVFGRLSLAHSRGAAPWDGRQC